jgi:heptosyltransferase-2
VAESTLIVKIAAIGDVVMALPMVSALKEATPSAQVSWLAGVTVAPLLRRVAGIDELITIDDNALFGPRRRARIAVVVDAWKKLSGRRFDRILIAHSDPRYRFLARTALARERRSLGTMRPRAALMSLRTHTDEYVRLVTKVDDRHARRFPNPPLDVALSKKLGERLASDRSPGRGRVVLAPGGARNAARDDPLRRWPAERYAELAKKLSGVGFRVLLTGGPDDDWVRQHFAGVDVLDLIGETDLPELVALYRECVAVVTNDSGPLHLARLAGTPVVGLFGPTPPAIRVREDSSAAVLWPAASMPCAPCYDGRNYAACDDNRCMQLITPTDVALRLESLLALARP